MFRMGEQVETWFSHVMETPPLTIKFDAFYMCLLVGLTAARRSQVSDAKDLIQRYPQAYQAARYGLLALMLSTEMKRLGVVASDRGAVERLIREYVNPEDQTSLSKDGFEAINEYSSGGFSILCERLSDKPRDLPAFLIAVTKLLQELTPEGESALL